jgi:transporter family-2 protein
LTTSGSLQASASVHASGGVFLCLFVLPFLGRAWVSGAAGAPWWSWLGGVIGSMLVVLANRAIGAVGVAAFTAVSVAAQLIVSSAMDHFAIMGTDLHLFTPGRAVGIILLVIGAILVVKA